MRMGRTGNQFQGASWQADIGEQLALYVFRARSIRSTLSLPEPTKVKRMVIWLVLVNRSSISDMARFRSWHVGDVEHVKLHHLVIVVRRCRFNPGLVACGTIVGRAQIGAVQMIDSQ